MGLKRKLPYFFTVLLILLVLAGFLLFGLSFSGEFLKNVPVIGVKTVDLSSGSYAVDTTELTAVVNSEDFALLDEFTGLVSADFSGSTCYSDILRWAEAHPGVAVRYTVTLPNGTTVDNSASAVDLTGLKHEDVGSAVSALQVLSDVRSISLGSSSQSASPVTADDIAALQAAFPAADVSYSIDFLGKSWPISTESVDLTGLTSAQVSEAAAGLSLLPNVKKKSDTFVLKFRQIVYC